MQHAVENYIEYDSDKKLYVDTLLLVERLHRRSLDVVKAELDRFNVSDVNNVQTLILYNIGDRELTVGELTNRGYYLGSNVSYNVKRLVENEYLIQERSPHDKRSVKVKLSEKGLDLCANIDAAYEKHLNALKNSNNHLFESLAGINSNLSELENFWSDCMNDSYKRL